MKYPMFSIRDKASATYMPPACELNEQTAVRNFGQAVNEGGLKFQCEDFDLYKVGFWDDQSGEFETMTPIFVVNGIQVRKENKYEV